MMFESYYNSCSKCRKCCRTCQNVRDDLMREIAKDLILAADVCNTVDDFVKALEKLIEPT